MNKFFSVFQTGMVGYPESLTDPSYRSQILTLTYPLIGNYGVPDGKKDSHGLNTELESDKIWASALIVGDYVEEYSHWNAKKSLSQWLKDEGVPGISGETLLHFLFSATWRWGVTNTDSLTALKNAAWHNWQGLVLISIPNFQVLTQEHWPRRSERRDQC